MAKTLDSICRLCLENCKDEWFNLLEDNVQRKIMLCLNTEIRSNDQIPKQICKNCRYQLEKTYYFRTKSKHSEAKLKKHIRLTNAGKESSWLSSATMEDDDYDDLIEMDQTMLESYNFFDQLEKEAQKTYQDEMTKAAEENEKYRENLQKDFDKRVKELQDKLEEDKKKLRKKEVANILRKIKNFVMTEQEEFIVDEVSESEFIVEAGESGEEPENDIEVESEHQAESSSPKEIYGGKMITKKEPSSSSGIRIEQSTASKRKKKSLNEEILTGNGGGGSPFKKYKMQQSKPVEYIIESFDIQGDSENVIQIPGKNNVEYFTITNSFLEDESPDKAESSIVVVPSQQQSDTSMELTDQHKDHYYVVLEDNDNIELDENGEKKIFKCVKCDLTFSRRNLCKNHYVGHFNLGDFTCGFCNKNFKSKSSCERHVRIHTDDRPFKCQFDNCNKSFSQKEVLKRHFATHSDVEPWKCDVCEKTFKLQDSLKQHKLRHGKKEHTCKVCGNAFTYLSGLSRHMLIHSGKKFECSYCDKVFKDQSSWRRHEKSLHMDQILVKSEDLTMDAE